MPRFEEGIELLKALWTNDRVTFDGQYYQLDLFSNFTLFLNDPVNGDQIEQSDRNRIVGGLDTSYERRDTVFGIPGGLLHPFFEVIEADPVVKGQTASSSYKPAILSNGVRTAVPPHVGPGTRIVVMTEDGSYVERAKD